MKFMLKKLALFGLLLTFAFSVMACVETTTEVTTAATTTEATTTVATTTEATTTEATTVITLSDAEKVQAVLDSIDLGTDPIVEDITLPTANDYGATVVWTSENQDVITDDGYVTIPDYDDGDVEVDLTVTVTVGAASDSKTITVTVSAESVEDFLTSAGAAIIIDGSDSIVADFLLPSQSRGATVTWESSNTDVVTISATPNGDGFYEVTVTRPVADDGGVNTTVTLTATITISDTSVNVTKTLRVLAEPPATIYTSFETLHSNAAFNEYIEVTGIVYSMFTRGYFIMDSEGGVLAVYTNDPDTPNQITWGDEVHLKGYYKNYNTLYQISDLVLQEVVSSDNDYTKDPIVLEDATDLLTLDSSNRLIHGQIYQITVTPQLLGTYNNVYLFQGEDRVATVYYNSLGDSIDALEAVAGKVVTINVVYYTFYSGSSVLEPGVSEVYITFDGTEDDIEEAVLVGQEALDADTTNLSIKTSVVGGQAIDLPAAGGYGSAITWAATAGAEYVTIADGEATFADVTAQQSVTLTATLTLDTLTATKDFVITVDPITTMDIADVKLLDPADADLVQVEGTVYFFINNGFFIFDETGMIFIYSPAPAGTELGDKLVIVGTYAQYNDSKQLTNAVVKQEVSTGNDYTQTPIVYEAGVTVLDPGQTYTITGTATLITSGSYTDLFIYDGDTMLFQVYYRSTINDSFNALSAEDGKEITFDAVYYYTSSGKAYLIYQEGAAGIEYTENQVALNDVEALETATSVVSDAVVTLPATVGTSTVTWAITNGATYATITGSDITYATVTAAQTVELTATITTPTSGDPIVSTKVFTVTISTYEEKLADDKTALDIALTGDEFDVVELPALGANGSVITWVVTSGTATLDGATVQFNYVGAQQTVVLTATLTLTKADTTTIQDTKEFTITVDPVTIVTDFSVFHAQTTPGTWDLAEGEYVFVRGVVTGDSFDGLFIQDANGVGLFLYKPEGDGDLEIGDEIVYYGKTASYKDARQLSGAVLLEEMGTGNAVISFTLTADEVIALGVADSGKVINVSGLTVDHFDSYGNIYLKVTGSTADRIIVIRYPDNFAPWFADVFGVGDVVNDFSFNIYNFRDGYLQLDCVVIEPTETQLIDVAFASLDIPEAIIAATTLTLPADVGGVALTYASDNAAVIDPSTGVVDLTGLTNRVTVTITVTAVYGGTTTSEDFVVLVGEVPLSTIAQVAVVSNDTLVKVEGIVIAGESDRNFMIQDATGGITIYTSNADFKAIFAANVGNKVEIIGTKTVYNGLIEINPESVVFVEVGTSPAATNLDAMTLDGTTLAPYMSMLVEVTNMYVLDVYTSSSGTTITLVRLSDGEEIAVRYDKDTVLSTATQALFDGIAEGDVISITGGLGWFYDPQILFTDTTLVSDGTAATEAELAAYEALVLAAPATPVTANFTLPVVGEITGTIAWVSSDSAIAISGADATVTRPANGSGDVTVTLTYTITVGSATETGTFDVVVSEEPAVQPTITELFISEYGEGGGSNKWIEIYNGTGADVDLSVYTVELYSNGSATATATATLTGTLAAGDVYVLYNGSADTTVIAAGDLLSGVANFNGDDAVSLSKNGTVIDVIGIIGQYGTNGTGGDWPDLTNHTIVRKATITGPVTTWDTTEWDVYAQDTFDYIGSHTVS